MPTFIVLRRVDAWIDYITEIEAESPESAAALASNRDAPGTWKKVGEEEFWNARFATLDERGEEIPESVVTRG